MLVPKRLHIRHEQVVTCPPWGVLGCCLRHGQREPRDTVDRYSAGALSIRSGCWFIRTGSPISSFKVPQLLHNPTADVEYDNDLRHGTSLTGVRLLAPQASDVSYVDGKEGLPRRISGGKSNGLSQSMSRLSPPRPPLYARYSAWPTSSQVDEGSQ